MEAVFNKENLNDVKRAELVQILKKLGEYMGYYLKEQTSLKFVKVSKEIFDDAMKKCLEAPPSSNVKLNEMYPLLEYMIKSYEKWIGFKAVEVMDGKLKGKEEEIATLKKELSDKQAKIEVVEREHIYKEGEINALNRNKEEELNNMIIGLKMNVKDLDEQLKYGKQDSEFLLLQVEEEKNAVRKKEKELEQERKKIEELELVVEKFNMIILEKDAKVCKEKADELLKKLGSGYKFEETQKAEQTEEQKKEMQAMLDEMKRLKSEKKEEIRMDKNIKKFNGNLSENWEDWIFQIDTFQKFNNIDDTKMLGLVTPLLQGNALQLLKKEMKKGTNWKEFRLVLESIYKSTLKERKIRKELRELKQTGKFETFLQKFQELSNQINIPEEEQLSLFIEALKPKTKCQLLVTKVQTMQQAMEQAAVLEECFGKEGVGTEARRVNYATTQFPRKSFKKEEKPIKFSRGGRFVSNVRGKPVSNGKPMKKDNKVSTNVKCYNCGKNGHLQKNCWVQKKARGVNCVVEVEQEAETGLTTSQIHKAFVAVSESYRLTEAKGTIGGYGCTMAFDSGATVNILSKKFAVKGLNLFRTHIANGRW